MAVQTCSNCRFSFGFDEDIAGGECRRYPPVVTQYKEMVRVGRVQVTQSHWPFVESDDWCGEWQEPFPPNPIPLRKSTL